ncbi:acyl-CoA dehydrogenase [Brevundimonas sp. GW460-12-10-14-LB2]|jgi:alkylation response protein AidB-like acyl-CoA dehydrogenase|uniref:acyl-CoA dehydrogenase family protein n=1 Tax=Brevundimonas sp. GW460-12-10-14-LB2 TaxID=1827469 RepID=UPI0007BC8FEE|nr:acyl-CoA dehydrogenase [Brevundimonas sp. GW460-12-10-14-LB2]ANC53026.1 acyl-CoA dehydrogenase [Brevundimonas sp. GW460-12-10-14-LB2]MEA3473095.1 acyl-CoA dehydrogenase [Pseudomonadota bacterium]
MPLILTEEQTMLQDAADGFLNEQAPIAHLRKLRNERDADGVSRDLWRAFGEMGFAGVIIPEAMGGMGLGAVEAGVIAESLGRTLTPSPYLGSSILSAKVLIEGGSQAQQAWLPRIAAGEAILALAVDEGAKHAPSRIATRAERAGNGFRLNGAKAFVLDGHVADALIVVATADEGTTLFLVDPATAGVEIERTVMVDAHNAARITLTDVAVDADAVIGAVGGGETLLDGALNLGRACAASSLTGAGDQAFKTTMDYLRTRKQFGKLIGEFQALQHRAAHLFSELELARAATIGAQIAIDEGREDAPLAASIAKAKAGRVAELAVQEAVQMHGGVGMTDAFDVGLFMKRVRVLNELLGDAGFHAERVARAQGF